MKNRTVSWHRALIVGGWCSALLQTVLYREILASVGGNELVLGSFLAGYLTWIAVGAALEGRAPARVPASWWAALAIVSGAVEAAVVRLSGWVLWAAAAVGLTGWQPGEIPPLLWGVVLSFMIALPSSVCLGVMFPRAVREGPASSGTYARAYVLESAGYIGGAVIGTAFLLGGAGNVLLFAVGAAAALVVLDGAALKGIWAAGCIGLVLYAGVLERATARRGGLIVEEIAAVGHSFVRTVAVSTTGTQEDMTAGKPRTLYSDCRRTAQYPSLYGDYPWLYAAAGMVREPKKALVAAEDPAAAEVLRQAGFGEVIVLTPDVLGLEMLLGKEKEALPQKGIFVRAGDPVRQLRRLRDVDLAYVGVPAPLSFREARYYSRSFHGALKGILSDGGIVVRPLELRPNYRGEAATRLLSAAWGLFRSEWRHTYAFRTDDTAYFIGSGAAVRAEGIRESLAARKGVPPPMPAVAEHIVKWDRSEEFREVLDEMPPVKTDETSVFLARLSLEEALHDPDSRPLMLWIMDNGRLVLVAAAVVLVLAVAAGSWAGSVRGTVALDAGAAGLAGLGVELAVMFKYQSSRGMVYVLGGLMVASFMLGFLLGAASTRRWKVSHLLATWAPAPGIALGLLYTLGAIEVPLLADGMPVLLLTLLGAGCGMNISALPARVEAESGDRAASAAWVDAFDHFGGAAGGLGAVLLLVPVLGIPGAVAGILALKAVTSVGVCLLEVRARA